MKRIYTPIIMVLLFLPLVRGYNINYNFPFNWTDVINQTILVNNTQSCFDPTTNITTNTTTATPFEFYLTRNLTGSLVGNTSDYFTFGYSNTGRTFNISYYNTSLFAIELNFTSDYELPEPIVLTLQNKNITAEVFKHTKLYFPLDIDYSQLDYTKVHDNQLDVLMWYYIINQNLTGNLTIPLKVVDSIEIELEKPNQQLRFNELIVDKLKIKHKLPLRNLTVTSDKNMTYSVDAIDGYQVRITPSVVGIYNIVYNATDIFGNSNSITTILNVLPSGVFFIKDAIIPSIKTGEFFRTQIFNTSNPILLNLYVAGITFTPENTSLYVDNNSTTRFYTANLMDDTGNSFYLTPGLNFTFSAKSLYYSMTATERGRLNIAFDVMSTQDVQINNRFNIVVKVSNVTILEEQTFDVAGRTTTCRLTNVLDLNNAERVCSTTLPMSSDMGNDLIILSQRDYAKYQESNQLAFDLMVNQKDNKITDLRTWSWIGWVLLFIFVITLGYVAYPKYWLGLKGGSK